METYYRIRKSGTLRKLAELKSEKSGTPAKNGELACMNMGIQTIRDITIRDILVVV